LISGMTCFSARFLSNTDPLLSLAMDAGWTVEENGYRGNLALRSTEVSAMYIELKITKYPR
jgi:hypothetical protein